MRCNRTHVYIYETWPCRFDYAVFSEGYLFNIRRIRHHGYHNICLCCDISGRCASSCSLRNDLIDLLGQYVVDDKFITGIDQVDCHMATHYA